MKLLVASLRVILICLHYLWVELWDCRLRELVMELCVATSQVMLNCMHYRQGSWWSACTWGLYVRT